MLLKKLFFIILSYFNTNFNANDTSVISITKGDITHSSCSCIVNAANEQLAGGAGVCGAIFSAAGWNNLQAACDQLKSCVTGQAKITDSFALKNNGIDYIIHAVGPDCRIITDAKMQDTLLQETYENALKLAETYKIKSIAFPFISSAIYAFPKERAAKIALQTVHNYAKHSDIHKIEFVLFSQEDYALFTCIQRQIL
ncbi:MAG: hypothetical protein CL947_01445 [Epsilonproteobacteria bacterium]|nr:hypothetical protein [Campylobacterota bacterium]|tara:strand:+ start:345 stop:938 length:594 start_codon:yes stop_codon:yes gene_type:complete